MRNSASIIAFLIIVGAISFSSTGCSERKSVSNDTIATADSLHQIDTVAVDTMDKLISETPMPKAADELFDDFFFNFAANRKLQLRRIKFPLPVVGNDSVTHISASQWKTEHFFMHQDFYTLIFDNYKQMNLVKKTTINHVVVEKLYLKKQFFKQYVFDRINGQWNMTAIRHSGLSKNRNASFLHFYSRFTSDADFQLARINDPLDFSCPNPDDEFSNMDGFLAPEQWQSFAPELPGDIIYNILYDESEHIEGNQKILVIRGISNGQEMKLTFRIKEGGWKLVKMIM
ncbi:MAG: DUF4348 domain-containing protein [Prevotella sp.]